MIRLATVLALVLPLALLAGCNDSAPDSVSDTGNGVEGALPGPATTGGDSVTGMPADPGPNPSPPAMQRSDLPVDAADPALASLPGAAPGPLPGTLVPGMAVDAQLPLPIEPTADDAAALVRDYYAAIGAYTLRRSVVDGASDGQRAWRLHSADIREVQL